MSGIERESIFELVAFAIGPKRPVQSVPLRV
jgi:hypothetical protein